MPRIDLVKKTPISASGRARQLEGMFDVLRKKESMVEWRDLLSSRKPEERKWENCIDRAALLHGENQKVLIREKCVLLR